MEAEIGGMVEENDESCEKDACFQGEKGAVR
jgi:hypothetical protein